MADNIESLMPEVDIYEGKIFKRRATDLERFESLIGEEEVLNTIGDLDTLEEIAKDIDSNLEGLLDSVEQYARLKIKKMEGPSTPLEPCRKRIIRRRAQTTN